MAETDERFLQDAVDRIWKAMFAVAVAGALAAFVWRGWTWSAGFVLGAVISALNFRWLKQVAMMLGSGRARPRAAVALGLRYLLLAGVAYVILKYSVISLPATLSGLFVAVAAVIFEILFELAYARNN